MFSSCIRLQVNKLHYYSLFVSSTNFGSDSMLFVLTRPHAGCIVTTHSTRPHAGCIVATHITRFIHTAFIKSC